LRLLSQPALRRRRSRPSLRRRRRRPSPHRPSPAPLEEELRREHEEKARVANELEELRRDADNGAKGVAEKVQLLEREVDKSKESERKMLESLIYQTKQLEQTKISLEEAKLEIATLRQANKGLEEAAATRRGGVEQRSVRDLMFGGAEEEIRVLRGEVRAAMQGEERSRKADDLSIALCNVTMEAKQVKALLSEVQAELEGAGRARVPRLCARVRGGGQPGAPGEHQARGVAARHPR
jgi:hypothetical protein